MRIVRRTRRAALPLGKVKLDFLGCGRFSAVAVKYQTARLYVDLAKRSSLRGRSQSAAFLLIAD